MIGANGITDGVHIRMMVTRGVRRSPYQDPRLAIGGATVVIIPEWKRPRPEMLARGVRLFTVHIRRTRPTELDQKLKSHSTLNCILACIHAMEAGADEALMLDDRGFVASCNTHCFIVRKGELWTSAGGYCLGGIAPGTVLQAARRKGVPAFEKDFSLLRATPMAQTTPSPPAHSRALFRSRPWTAGRSGIPQTRPPTAPVP